MTTRPGFRKPKKPTKAQRANAAAKVTGSREREKELVLAKMQEFLEGGYRPPELEGVEGPDEELAAKWWDALGWGKEPETLTGAELVEILSRFEPGLAALAGAK